MSIRESRDLAVRRRAFGFGLVSLCAGLLGGCFPEIKVEATSFPSETTAFRIRVWQSTTALPSPPIYLASSSAESAKIERKDATGLAYSFDLDLPNTQVAAPGLPLAVTVGAFDDADCLLATGTTTAVSPFQWFDITKVVVNLESNTDIKRPDQCKTAGPILKAAELRKIYSAGDAVPIFEFSATGYGFDPLSSIVINLSEDVSLGATTVTKGEYRFCSAFPASEKSTAPSDCLPKASVVASSAESLTVSVKESENGMPVKLAKIVFASSEFAGVFPPSLKATAFVVNEAHSRHPTMETSNSINVLK